MFLALSAAFPEMAPSAVTIGQAGGSSLGRPRLSVCTLSPLAEDSETLRAGAIEVARGLGRPLPAGDARAAADVLCHVGRLGYGP